MAALKNGPAEIYFDQVLGGGAYGEVYRARCGMLPCAAKALHSALFQYQDPGESVFMKKFDEECQFLSSIKHPNIIQYLGTTVDDKSGRHVLLMEIMDESLTKLLERSKQMSGCLPYSSQISISCDIALALTYLHYNDIIHRDLSSNNVLLLAGTRAKVADFGVSTILDKNLNRLTMCPGSKVYMPPEAQTEPPDYTDKLDCFSFGVLIIQMATLNFPDPGSLYRSIQNADYPSGIIQVFVPEYERRKSDIVLVAKDHPLLPMALNCLRDCAERPSAQKMCEQLLKMRAEVSEHQNEDSEKSNQAEFIETLLQALGEKTEAVEELREKLVSAMTPGHVDVIDSGLDASENRFNGVEGPEQDCIGSVGHETLPSNADEKTAGEVSIEGWVYEASPDSFSAYDGTCVFDTDNHQAYFLKKAKLYCYRYGSHHEQGGKWSKVTDSSYRYCGLALVGGKLTTISGWYGLTLSKLVLTLNGTDSWEEVCPPIPTGREAPACLSTFTHLVVLGGVVTVFSTYTCCVEVLDLYNRQWSSATNTPDLRTPQAVLCGDTMYLSSFASDKVYSCQIRDLLQSTGGMVIKEKKVGSIWSKVQCLPTSTKASITAIGGHMFAVGGRNEDGRETNLIYRYDQGSNQWKEIGRMPTARQYVLAGISPDGRVMCIGGQSEASQRVVEIGRIRELMAELDAAEAPGRAKSCIVM